MVHRISSVVVYTLFIFAPIVCVVFMSSFCNVVLSIFSSVAIISLNALESWLLMFDCVLGVV